MEFDSRIPFKCFMISFISKYKNYQTYQKHDIFQSLRPNSSSVTKIKWNLCPICQNWQKFDQFQAISRVPENSWNFPGMMKFSNSVLKIKFLDINWVRLIPYMLKSAKTSYSMALPKSWNPKFQGPEIVTYSKMCAKLTQIGYVG